MLSIFTAISAKKSARTLEKFMKAKGYELKLGEALEALGAMSGNKNWAALSQTLTEKAVDDMLKPFELNHIGDAGDADIRAEETGAGGYGPECTMQMHTGFLVKMPAYPEECSYIRVCDPLGREISYWISDEWKDAPEEVMGAIFGALNRGSTLEVTGMKSETPAALKRPVIQDVDFNFVSNVLLDGTAYRVNYREEEVLAELRSSEKCSEEEADAKDALRLDREEDGLVWEETLTLLNLRELTWDAKQTAFVNLEGTTFEFFVERKFGT